MRRHGELIAREALAFGFNTTLAPVLDLALPVSAAVMGSRVTSPNPLHVVTYARNLLAGLAAQGVVGCGKHFPGLGGGTLDSHLETPKISRSWTQLWSEVLVPYQQLARDLPMVMVNHAAYPQTRGGELPATASAFWITTVLKKRIGYKGLIFSDDMEMGGILKAAPIEEAVVLAVRAGIHLMEICHSPELILRGFEALIAEAERSAVFRKLLIERAAISGRLRKARFGNPMTRALSEKQLAALRGEVKMFTAKVEGS
jgi:beta-N-acetylhexosaminidase